MNFNKQPPKADIDREAADWVVRWEDREHTPGAGEQSRWFGWLRRSPQHVQSYLDTAELYERLGRMDPGNRIDVDEWLAEKRTPVVAIAAMEAVGKQTTPPFWRTRPAAALAASVLGAAMLLAWQLYHDPAYRTGVGEQSLHTLADGSVLNLNTRSKARVAFTDHLRLIELEGEGLFTVAPDPARPFIVRTRGASVQALGTRFNVYEHRGETKVMVMEGAVQIAAAAGAAHPAATRPVVLIAGEAGRIAGPRADKQILKVSTAIAWQNRKLVFEDATLAEVAEQFNRYNEIQIRFADDTGTRKRLSGTFDALHPQSLVLYLERDPGVAVSREGDVFSVRSAGVL